MTHTEQQLSSDDIVVHEIEFKGGRREYFVSPDKLSLSPEDYVIVQADRGEHIGKINRIGPRTLFPQAKDIKSIIRHASYTDMQVVMDNKSKEEESFSICQEKIAAHGLKMKLVDVEYQFDGNKICFFFTADKRIDFRALVKDLAAEYRTRIELRQIGVRDEARRIGGLGVCGRSLCCKTFLTHFGPITSQMARDQNLSLSPSKISGLCGRLMCCLAYEEDFYKHQSDVLPEIGVELVREGVRFKVVKVDIFTETFHIRDEQGGDLEIAMEELTTFTAVENDRRRSRKKTRCCDNECPSEGNGDSQSNCCDNTENGDTLKHGIDDNGTEQE